MILMNMKLDNFYGFKDFEINFSYPKKIVNTTIPFEYLEDRPNFRFKRVNILMGANASGKTVIGKAMMQIFNFISDKFLDELLLAISNPENPSFFEVDFVLDDLNLYRINFYYEKGTCLELSVLRTAIRKGDSYERAIKNLKMISGFHNLIENIEEEPEVEYKIHEALKVIERKNLRWYFTFPNEKSETYKKFNIKVLNAILKSLDPSIDKVEKSSEGKDVFIIIFKSGYRLFIQEGKIVKGNILSSGTEEGIAIAHAITSMKDSTSRPYYFDEKFSHVQTDVEINILNLLIDLLDKKSQLFFTTHNTDILEMNLPIHSYTFLKKIDKIEVVYPSKTLKRNDISLVNAVKNDLFNTIPDTDLLYSLLEDEENEVL